MSPIAPQPRSAFSSPRRRCATRGAFTLTELVIVVLVMAILTAVAVPTFVDSLLFFRVESAARRLKADLELVRQTARLTSAAQTFTLSGRTYTTSAGVAGLDTPGQAYSVDLAKPPYELEAVTSNLGSDSAITFNGFGMPSGGANLVLRAGDHSCTVAVNATTGEITVTSSHPGGRTLATN